MQITRETDYAIRCVSFLAGRNGSLVMIEEIARECLVPRSFLAKILQKLSKAGLVESQRGSRGGFALSREPKSISLFDVVVAIQGPIPINTCVVNPAACGLMGHCAIHPIWVQIQRDIDQKLKETSFEKLTVRKKKS